MIELDSINNLCSSVLYMQAKQPIDAGKDAVKKRRILFLAANPTAKQLKLDEEVKKIKINLKLAKEREFLDLERRRELFIRMKAII